jgi:hypothetical protein
MSHMYIKRKLGNCEGILVLLGSDYVYRKSEKGIWYD